MKKRLLFLIVVCIKQLNIFAQNEISLLSAKAKIALIKDDTTLALKYYLAEIDLNPSKPFDYLTAVKYLDETNDYINLDKVVRKLLAIGYPIQEIDSKVSSNFKNSNQWNSIQKSKDSIVENYNKSLNKNWLNELGKMTFSDQEIRQVYMKSFKDTVRKEKLLFSMNIIDSINFDHLLATTKLYGFPNYKTVGYSGVNDVWILLWHHRGKEFEVNPLWKEIMPFIEKEISVGNLDKDFLTMFIDDNEIANGRPMVYGTLYGYFRGLPEFDQYEVIEPKDINLRRKQVGLAPIDLWLEALKLPLPEKLKGISLN
jgi:uncharacterized protein with HEPN domain